MINNVVQKTLTSYFRHTEAEQPHIDEPRTLDIIEAEAPIQKSICEQDRLLVIMRNCGNEN